MIDSHDYELHLDGTGAKTGVLVDPSAALPAMDVASPPEFGGPEGVWSPEHLFVGAVSACLMTTFRTIASLSKLDVVDYSDDATGALVRADDGLYRMERVTLRPHVVIGPDASPERAQRLLEKADRACLVSRSVCSEVIVEPTIEVSGAPM